MGKDRNRLGRASGSAEAMQIAATLKSGFKTCGLRYVDLAVRLGVSVPTIKRWLAAPARLTVTQVEQLAALANLTLAQLMENVRASLDRDRPPISLEQERALAGNLALALVRQLVAGGWTLSDIVTAYGVDEATVIGLLLRLERLRVIDLMPGNRIVYLLSRTAAWNRGGPMERIIADAVGAEVLAYDPTDPLQHRFAEAAELSDTSIEVMHAAIASVVRQIQVLQDNDRRLPRSRKRWVATYLLLKPAEWSMVIDEKDGDARIHRR